MCFGLGGENFMLSGTCNELPVFIFGGSYRCMFASWAMISIVLHDMETSICRWHISCQTELGHYRVFLNLMVWWFYFCVMSCQVLVWRTSICKHSASYVGDLVVACICMYTSTMQICYCRWLLLSIEPSVFWTCKWNLGNLLYMACRQYHGSKQCRYMYVFTN
jgi:hypothetical protein